MSKLTVSAFMLIVGMMGCATAPQHLKEYSRTGLYIQCIQTGISVTVCQCIEERTLAVTKQEVVESEEEGLKFATEAQKQVAQCNKDFPAPSEAANEQ